ncbi:hypothetical protein SAMN06295974_1700 [Plantibacter flavus]|uniref:DUF1430 domain-containing protein n=1 Tax=Plantibacter flavus TaxID=150123 RepID=A0A3N2C7Z4_9MICO|nr:hypothetical protein [Plantibacter flavus]ROR83629.1 hypothetical protein EDD42_3743 [Plantibacter flavus]SMG25635.1 hypothetical protein SAMN06295974_1700 [Plantibacter flavus]
MALLTRLALCCTVLLTLGACYLAFQGVDEVTFDGAATAVVVQSIPAQATRLDAISAVRTAAEAEGVSIVKVVADPEDIDHSRIVLTFDDAAAGYRPFSSAIRTIVRPIGDGGTSDLRGLYLIDGSARQGARIVSSLESLGYLAQTESRSPQAYVMGTIAKQPAVATIGMATLLAVGLALVFHASQAQKRRAVALVNGWSEAQFVLAELRGIAVVFGQALIVFALLGVVALGFINGWAQLGGFVAFTVPIVLVVFLIISGMALLALLLLPNERLASLIAGKRPVLYLAVAAAMIQSVTMWSLLTAFTSASSQVSVAAASAAELDHWRASTDLLTLRFTPMSSELEWKALEGPFREVVQTLDGSGQLLLAVHPSVVRTDDYGADGNRIIVNNEFLRRQAIISEDGTRVAPVAEEADHLTLLIPEQLTERIPDIVETYEDEAAFQMSLAGLDPHPITIEVIRVRDGQRIFNYSQDLAQPAQADPVVAVIPAASEVLSSDFYLSNASSGGVLVSDDQATLDLLDRVGITARLASLDTAADFAIDALQTLQSAIRGLQLSIAFTVLVLAFSATVLASAYCQGQSQAIFTRFTNGWSFLASHRTFLISSLGGTALLLCAGVITTTRDALPWAAVILAVECILVLGLVRLAEHRLRGDLIKRY